MHRDRSCGSGTLQEALAFQARILPGVSRTFALTIPSLPRSLRVTVGNAYLLCRIADTVEDDPSLTLAAKREFGQRFVAVLNGNEAAAAFSRDLAACLAPSTPADERALIERTGDVVRVTHSFDLRRQSALVRCVALMSDGMHRFQNGAGLQGLESQHRLDEYCYFVAGVVGEMLTELFCAHSAHVARRRERLMALAPSFGQGLQMTNILKDVWDDRARGICWLPRPMFGLDPAGSDDLVAAVDPDTLERGIRELTAVAHGHLRNALEYTLEIPRRHLGIRRFCLWALGMAAPTLANIHADPGFGSGDEVKISREQVRRIVRQYGLMAGSNAAIRTLFGRASASLPKPEADVAAGLEEIARRAEADAGALTDTERVAEPIHGSLGVN